MSFPQIFDTEGLMPHGMCYLWEPGLLWTHVVSDVLIGLSYVAISVALAWLVWQSARERVDRAGPFERLPFWWMFLAFGLFIVACGVTHFMGAWTVWNPDYWASAGAKVVTAVASVATAVAFPPLIPRALRLVREARASEIRKRELEEAHRELSEAHARIRELDEAKTRFFANVSHELRTPLTLIAGPVQRMLAEDDIDREERRTLESVLRNARTLHKHVDDLLDVTRMDVDVVRPRYRRSDLGTLIRRIAAHFDGLARARDLTYDLDVQAPLPATIDPDQLERVALNLLSNAFKFTPDGGTVRVTLGVEGEGEEAPGTPVEADGEAGGGGEDVPWARLEVADSGPGVPEEMREAVFERFRQIEGGPTRAFGGTGLGLHIAREFVERHGGRMRIGDAPEGGASVVAWIPLRPGGDVEVGDEGATEGRGFDVARAVVDELQESGIRADEEAREGLEEAAERGEVVETPARKQEAGRPELAAAGGPASRADTDASTVLVVEDNAQMAAFITGLLPADVVGLVASDGEEGLRLARERKPDLILSDVMMPRMSGGELLRAVREVDELRDVPFIVLTARADEEGRVTLLEEGAQDYITKPFLRAEVTLRVRNWLSVARTRRVLQSELDVREDDMEALAGEVARRRRELESALEAARVAREEEALASRAKSDFLAVISHELRTPLTAIMGYADLMLEEIPGPVTERQRDQLGRIGQSADHLLDLIDQVLDFSRLERGELEPRMQEVEVAPLVEGIEAVVRPLADEKGLDLRVEEATADLSLRTDPGRLRQILLNLLTNAVKYTDEGSVRLTVEADSDETRFRVADTGPGIAPEHRDKIFGPFWQVDQSSTRGVGGAGLGLSIARRLARRLGGDVTLREREGGGSIFELTLPISTEDPGADPTPGDGV